MDRLPPPTTIGVRNRWYSSTNPASIAWAARSGPPTLISAPACAFICRIDRGSKSRSSRVLTLDTVSSVLEYTILSAAPPDLRVVPDERWLLRKVHGLPGKHHLIHPAAVEVGADRTLEFVDEGVYLLVRLGPVEVAGLIGNVAVERRDRRVDQLRHSEPPLASESRAPASCLPFTVAVSASSVSDAD